MGNSLEDKILIMLKNKVFSEYLPENYTMNYSKYDIYKVGVTYKDFIEPYSYTMSRFGRPGERRVISIPDPSAYVCLYTYLRNTKKIINDIIDLSVEDTNSYSRIVDSEKEIVEDDGVYNEESVTITDNDDISLEEESSRSIYIRNMLEKIDRSKGACGILHIDISEFYNSIYTHAITTIKLGADDAYKAYKSADGGASNIDFYVYDVLDKHIRALKGKRTNGIITGPFVSRIVSEAILSNVDKELRKLGYVFSRYADDYEFVIYDRADINKTLSDVGRVFERYYLRINNEKTIYEEYPFYVFSNFEHILGVTEKEKEDIEIVELFNKFWALEKKGEKGAIRYFLKAYQNKYKVKDQRVFTNYLINVLCNDEKAIGLASKIIIREYQNKRIIIDDETRRIIINKLRNEMDNQHEFEAIWLLYLLRHIGCTLEKSMIQDLWNSKFELLKVLMLHEFRIRISKKMMADVFDKSKSWILLYELTRISKDRDAFYLKLNVNHSKAFYDKLFDNDVSFYE